MSAHSQGSPGDRLCFGSTKGGSQSRVCYLILERLQGELEVWGRVGGSGVPGRGDSSCRGINVAGLSWDPMGSGRTRAGLRLSVGFCWACFSSFFFFFLLLGLHVWHMQVPRLGVESEQQLTAYATATVTQDPSHVCDLSLQQHQVL